MTDPSQLENGLGVLYDEINIKYNTYQEWEDDLVNRILSLQGEDQAIKDALVEDVQNSLPLSSMFGSDEQDAIQQTISSSFFAGGGAYLADTLSKYYGNVGNKVVTNVIPDMHLGEAIETALIELGQPVNQNFPKVSTMGKVMGGVGIGLGLTIAASEVYQEYQSGGDWQGELVKQSSIMATTVAVGVGVGLAVGGVPGAIAGAIMAGSIGYMMDKHWDDILDLVQDAVDLGKSIQEAIDDVQSNLGNIFNDFLENPIGELQSALDFGKNTLSKLFDNINDSNNDDREDGLLEIMLNWLFPPEIPIDLDRPDDQGSPLVLDLDGDGVELYEVGAYGSYFDLQGNGQAILTGWVEPDDGLLALDVNADGKINDINELFGNETTDGFTELAVYDSNGDGVIGANDTVFSDLLVWTDVNSDGISQADELHTLTDLGIISISLDATRVAGEEIAGNPITHEATYTLDGGTERAIVDAWFAYDTFYTQNIEAFTVDIRTMFLPTLKGFGDLKDLHMAVSLDNGATPDTMMEQLIAFVDGLTLTDALTNWDSVYTGMEALMLNWAGVDGVDPSSRGAYVDARHLAFYEAFRGYAFEQYNQPNPLPEAGKYTEAIFQYLVTHAMIQVIAQTDGKAIFADSFYNLRVGGTDGDKSLLQAGIDAVQAEATAAPDGVSVWMHFAQFLGYTRGLDNLTTDEITALDTAVAATGEASLSDWQDVVSTMNVILGTIIDSGDDWGSFEIYYDNNNVGTSGDDVMIDDNAGGYISNEFRGRGGSDTIQGLDGHDKLSGGAGDDILEGGAGDDYLLGGTGNDIYLYESGNDTISEVDGDGIDELHIMASTGLDHTDLTDLYRYGDNLILLLSTGDYITVHDYNGTDSRIETIVFDADGTADGTIDLTSMLEEKHYGTEKADKLEVSGTSVQTQLVYAYGGNDVIQVTGSAANFYGGDGYDTLIGNYLNDSLHGDNQDDYLFGLNGDDALSGGNGEDTLDGGTGNDTLDGDADDDTYIFGRGYGQDTIQEGASGSGTDTVKLSSDVLVSDLIVSRADNHSIQLSIDGTTDTLLLDKQEYYTLSNAQIENILFDDGTVWNPTQLREMALETASTDGDDTIYGFKFSDDTLDGGLGNDTLRGLYGDDTYIFALGYGQDVVDDRGGSGDTDTVAMQSGISPDDVIVSRGSYDSIVLAVDGTGDELTLYKQEYYSVGSNRIEQVVFADATTWVSSDLRQMSIETASTDGDDVIKGFNVSDDVANGGLGADTIYGYNGNDTLSGGSGNDTLYGGDDDDVLNGNAENDSLNGGNGADQLSGGTGNDVLSGDNANDSLYGGEGDDEYLFNSGDDQDVISDADGENDVIRLGSGFSESDVVLTEVGTYDLEITFTNSPTDKITIIGQRDNTGTSQIEKIVFDDHSELSLLGSPVIEGTTGADTLQGTQEADIFAPLAGDDMVYGYEGDDLFIYSDGEDYFSGGDGIDTADYSGFGSAVLININAYSSDEVKTRYDTNLMIGTWHEITNFEYGTVENAIGTAYDDKLYGDSGSNLLIGGAGDDILSGVAGNDFLHGGLGSDEYTFGVNYGHDVIVEDGGDADYIKLSSSFTWTDLVLTTVGSDLEITFTNAPNDKVTITDQFASESSWVETIAFDTGMIVNISPDAYLAGNDLTGTAGSDTLRGTPEDDTFAPLAGDDTVYGYEGDDTFIYSDGEDYFNGGDGIDTADYSGFGSAVLINLFTYSGTEVQTCYSTNLLTGTWHEITNFEYGTVENAVGTAYDDKLIGDNGDNVLRGGAGNDKLVGVAGNDLLYGDAGVDLIYGGTGNDFIYSGDGADTLYGEAGADTFVFEEASAFASVDEIEDFSVADGDAVEVSDLLIGYDPVTDLISDFVQITTDGVDSSLIVDRDGTGSAYVYELVANLNGVTGLSDEAALEASGNLIAA